MRVFLDFEASSLGKRSYPIEVAWVFEDGSSAEYLIAPEPGWIDWDPAAQAIHQIDRATLIEDGKPAQDVADMMVERLAGHELYASAPSWDGKWLNTLFRAAGLPKHALRLRDTDEALMETVRAILREAIETDELGREVETILVLAGMRRADAPAHRALPDALGERAVWIAVRDAALARLAELRPG